MKPKYQHHHLHGLIPVWKPKGMSSKDVSRQIEKKFGRIKMGHVGTLDPGAEGLLPILVGKATKLQDFLLERSKTYIFEIQLGMATTTMDMEGEVIEECKVPSLEKNQVETVLSEFVGKHVQIPPVYSAIKYQGKPLYSYARQAKLDELPDLKTFAREVEIYDLKLHQMEADCIVVEAHCSKGTYVRVLGYDIAERLGTKGAIRRLVRSAAAGFSRQDAIDLEDVLDRSLEDSMIALEELPLGLKQWQSILPAWTKRLKGGQSLDLRPDLFTRGYRSSEVWEGLLKEQVLLLDEQGAAFGLGHIAQQESSDYRVTLSRGLM